VLADLNMPVMDGCALARRLKDEYPSVRLIILSMVDDLNIVADVINSGAAAYLLKNSETIELIFAIRFVVAGYRYLSADLGFNLLARSHKPTSLTLPQDKGNYSARELEVLRLIAEGLTNTEIAEKIFVSKRTVEGHRQSLLTKTSSKNTAVLIKNAVSGQLI
jgi:DNA-binding NarL/FixJ family response regulator